MEAAAGQLREACDPYRLVLPGDAGPPRAAPSPTPCGPGSGRTPPSRPSGSSSRVPEPPVHAEGVRRPARPSTASASPSAGRAPGATSAKWKAGDQRYPLAALTGVEWHSPEGPGGHLRLLPAGGATGDPRPDHDLAAVVFGVGYGAVHESLPFAAAVLAALRGPRPRSPPCPGRASGDDRLRHLSELHSAGLLTDAEYAALRDRFTAGA